MPKKDAECQKSFQMLKDSEGRRLFHESVVLFVPQALVNLGLDELYVRNPNKAISELEKKWDFTEKWWYGNLIIMSNFATEKNQFKKHLLKIDEETFLGFSEMYLFYAVSIFERCINTHFYEELEISHNFDPKAINTLILRRVTSVREKLGWFLELINGKNFVREKPKLWDRIVKVIDQRNFLMHYKPGSEKRFLKYSPDFDKGYLLEFLDNCSACNRYLKSIRSDKVKNYYKRIDKIRKLVKKEMEYISIKVTAANSRT